MDIWLKVVCKETTTILLSNSNALFSLFLSVTCFTEAIFLPVMNSPYDIARVASFVVSARANPVDFGVPLIVAEIVNEPVGGPINNITIKWLPRFDGSGRLRGQTAFVEEFGVG
jgi:hypothetical protein